MSGIAAGFNDVGAAAGEDDDDEDDACREITEYAGDDRDRPRPCPELELEFKLICSVVGDTGGTRVAVGMIG